MTSPNKFTKSTVITSSALIAYGVLCRKTGTYFFWESLSIGWVLLLIALISWLAGKIKSKAARDVNRTVEKILIGIVLFILTIQVLLVATIPSLEAFITAKKFLETNSEITAEIGPIRSFSLIPLGQVHINPTENNKGSGYVQIYVTAKGEKKFKDIAITLTKDVDDKEWKVGALE